MRFEILGLSIEFTVLLLQQDVDIINYVYFGLSISFCGFVITHMYIHVRVPSAASHLKLRGCFGLRVYCCHFSPL